MTKPDLAICVVRFSVCSFWPPIYCCHVACTEYMMQPM